MNGVSTHTHDYIAIGGYKEEKITLKSCELCAGRFWTDSLNPFKDYDMVCEECIRLSEEQDKEESETTPQSISELSEKAGFNEACMKIYDMIKSGEIKEPIDILHLVKL